MFDCLKICLALVSTLSIVERENAPNMGSDRIQFRLAPPIIVKIVITTRLPTTEKPVGNSLMDYKSSKLSCRAPAVFSL
jgi:hypothetical protein